MTDDYYIPQTTTAPAPLVLTDDEKRTRRNRVLSLAGILFIVAIILTLNGDFSTTREMHLEFGKYLGMILVVSFGFYSSFQPKAQPSREP